MMGKPNPAVKEALFILGVLTVAFAVGITVIAVWLAENSGGEAAPAAPPAAAPPPAGAPPPAPPPPPPATTAAPPAPPAATGAAPAAGDPAAGKQVFATAGCTSCHTLADAGASGTVGPNLDDAKPPLERVIDRVTNGKGVMPPFKGQLTDKQIQDVAAYVVQATSG